MYRIAVLAKTDQLTRSLADQIIRFYTRLGIFPQIERCWDQERFFSCVAGAAPTSAVIALPGVAGLNAVEHLRSLDPKCASSGAGTWIFPSRPFGCGLTIS